MSSMPHADRFRVGLLADVTGLTIDALRRVLMGRQTPSLTVALQLSDLLGRDVEDLFEHTVRRGKLHVDCTRNSGSAARR